MLSKSAAHAALVTLSLVCLAEPANADAPPIEPVAPPAAPSEAPASEPVAPPAAPPPAIAEPPPAPLAVSPRPVVHLDDGPHTPRRSYGIGSVSGVGFSGVYVGPSYYPSSSGAKFAFLLPTLELRIFNERGHSIDISVPALNIIVASSLAKLLVFSTDVFYNVNAGSGQTRFLFGPGLGLSILSDFRDSIFGLRIPLEIGAEFLNKSYGAGFRLVARPWAELDFAKGRSASSWAGFGGGIMFDLGFTIYRS